MLDKEIRTMRVEGVIAGIRGQIQALESLVRCYEALVVVIAEYDKAGLKLPADVQAMIDAVDV